MVVCKQNKPKMQRYSMSLMRVPVASLMQSAFARSFTRCFSSVASPSISASAAVARSAQLPFTVESVSLRAPRNDEVVVKVVATGLCHTDVAVKDRALVNFPIVLGHEGVGVVENVGKGVTQFAKGDHVLMSYASCGACSHCNIGKPAYCYEHGRVNFAGTHLDGTTSHVGAKDNEKIYGSFFRQSSFCTHSLATENNLVKLPRSLDLPTMAPLGCGVQTGAGAVLNTLKASVGSTIAIFGCGAVGLSAVMAAKLAGCRRIIALDLNPYRLQLAKELGATHTIAIDKSTDKGAIVKEIQQISGDVGVEYALDTSGNKVALRTAFDSLKPLGVAGLIGGAAPGTEVGIEMLSLLPGKQLRGVIQGDAVPKNFIPMLIEFYQQGKFPFDKLITFYRGGLADVNRAVAESKDVNGKVIKPVIIL